MAGCWVDIEDSAGNKLGEGPILTATRWSQTDRLDKAGAFEFEMPASDPRAALLAPKRVARCWSVVGGAVVEQGAGVIDKIEVTAGTPTMLRVSGDNLLAELRTRLVGSLQLYKDVRRVPLHLLFKEPADSRWSDLRQALDGNAGTWDTMHFRGSDIDFLTTRSYLYIASDRPFGDCQFTLGAQKNAKAFSIEAQYFDGSGWITLGSFVDGTAIGGVPFAQSGIISWAIPADMTQIADDGGTHYYVRISPSSIIGEDGRNENGKGGSDNIDVVEATVLNREPTDTAYSQVMALAPAGWARDTTSGGHSETAASVLCQFADENVLAALVKIVDLTGEHFRLGPGRTVSWLRRDPLTATATIRAIGPSFDPVAVEGNADVALIQKLTRTHDTYDLMTRLHPYGGGSGSAQLMLADTTRAAPAGYTLNKSQNWLRRDAAEAEFGQIDQRRDWTELTPLSPEQKDREEAANKLFDAALVALARASYAQRAYELTLVKCDREVLPGQRITVSYHEWVDGYEALGVEETLIVLEVTREVDSRGARTVGLVVSTTDAWPQSDADVLARLIGQQAAYQRLPQTVQASDVRTSASGLLVATASGGGSLVWKSTGLSGGGGGSYVGGEVIAGDGLTGGGVLPSTLTLAIGQGDGISVSSDAISVDGTVARTSQLGSYVPTSRTISAGDGLIGGGDLSANRTLAVDSTVVRTSRQIIAGSGLTGGGTLAADRALAVVFAAATPTSVSLAAGAVGSAAKAATEDHRHALDVTISPVWTGDHTFSQAVKANAGIVATGAVSVSGGDLTVGANVLFVDQSAGLVGVNCVPDPQFALDVNGNIRAQGWLVGKHAVQVSDAALIAHFDGALTPGDYTGNATGHMGQVPTISGGVSFVPGKFGKGVQVAQATTNLLRNGDFETSLSGWQNSPVGGTVEISTERALFGTHSLKMVSTGAHQMCFFTTEQPLIAVANGETVTASAWAYVSAAVSLADVSFTLRDQSNANLVRVDGVPALGQWVRMVCTWSNSTGSTVNTYLRLQCNAAGVTVYWDGIQYERLAYATPTALAGLPGCGINADGTITRAAGHLRYTTGLPTGTTSTAMAWVYVDNAAAHPNRRWVFQSAPTWATQAIAVYIQENTTNWSLLLNNAVRNVAVTTGWHHVAIVHDGTIGRAFLDGAQIGADFAVPATCPWASFVTIGESIWGGSYETQRWTGGIIDDFVILSRAASAAEIRAIYESNAPVFAETSVWGWRTPNNLAWADEEGLWARTAVGHEAFAVAGVAKSWGGVNLDAGDVLIGRAGANVLWDDSAATLAVTGAIHATSGSLDGFLTLGLAGGIYQGTGTFDAPDTGLKLWNEGGIGRIAGFNAGVEQVGFGTDGKLYADKTYLANDGLSFEASVLSEAAKVKWRNTDGSTISDIIAYPASGFAGLGATWRFFADDTAPGNGIRMQVYSADGATLHSNLYVGKPDYPYDMPSTIFSVGMPLSYFLSLRSDGAVTTNGKFYNTNYGYAVYHPSASNVRIQKGITSLGSRDPGTYIDTITIPSAFTNGSSWVVQACASERGGNADPGAATYTTWESIPKSSNQFAVRWSHSNPTALAAYIHWIAVGT